MLDLAFVVTSALVTVIYILLPQTSGYKLVIVFGYVNMIAKSLLDLREEMTCYNNSYSEV